MRLIVLFSLFPLTLSIPQPQISSLPALENLEILHHSNDIQKRSLISRDDEFVGTSIVGEKDTSTLTSLIVFHSDLSPTQTSSSISTSTSTATTSEKEKDQIVSPFYPSNNEDNDDEEEQEEKGNNTSIQSLNQGQTVAFNPTPTTTLTFLSNSLASITETTKNVNSTGTQSAVVAAAASNGSSSNSISGSTREAILKFGTIWSFGILGLTVIYLV
ncbi:uncharacterized protein I206_103063 [Kwoniella pini CBS 10737]|uniref:Mid2 domain-containing protein n=1 Tax=Kwoniella pini CBS 10737 TaxID=1296096 RepID=A0A1B9IBA0_9TREE|nr:uncharacterized protein I206_01933 [Kwoniella pini CBS 10737]OCF52640.1 hypothetical protein I206_01933 [Kwoniella pini CBS 10737]